MSESIIESKKTIHHYPPTDNQSGSSITTNSLLTTASTKKGAAATVEAVRSTVATYSRGLSTSLTLEHLDATLQELHNICSASGRRASAASSNSDVTPVTTTSCQTSRASSHCLVHFLAQLFCAFQTQIATEATGSGTIQPRDVTPQASANDAHPLALVSILEHLSQGSLLHTQGESTRGSHGNSFSNATTIICTALNLATSRTHVKDQEQQSSSSVLALLKHIHKVLVQNDSFLSRVLLNTAVCCGGKVVTQSESELVAQHCVKTLLSDLEQEPKWETVLKDNFYLRQFVCFALLHTKLHLGSTELKQQKEIIVHTLTNITMSNNNNNNEGNSSSIAAGMADRLAPGTEGFSSQSSTAHAITNLLADLGPACTQSPTTLRDTLREITNDASSITSTKLDEHAMAHLLHFFSLQATITKANANDASSSAAVATLTNNFELTDTNEWSLPNITQVLSSDDYTTLNWNIVASKFDNEHCAIRSTAQFVALLKLYSSCTKNPLPVSAICGTWDHPETQLSFLEQALSVPPTIYSFSLDVEETEDANTAGDLSNQSCPNAQGWASTLVLDVLLRLSDDQRLARRVRDLFVKGLFSCPEVLLCALVRRLQTSANANAGSQGNSTTGSSNGDGSGNANSNVGMQMKGELMRELIPLFFKQTNYKVQNGPAAIRRLWSIAPNTVTAACIEAWRSTANEAPQSRHATIVHVISIIRLLPNADNASAVILNGNKDYDFSMAVAFVMADNDMLQLRPWLTERAAATHVAPGMGGSTRAGIMFLVGLIGFLGRNHAFASPRVGANSTEGKIAPLLSIENLTVALQFLRVQDPSILSQDLPSMDSSNVGKSSMTIGASINAITEASLKAHPSMSSVISRPSNAPNSQSVADDMANSYFQKIYTSEQSIDEVVDMLKRFKTSGNAQENEIFACMIHNLFDEYRFFSKYPEKELRITGILFGKLIQHQLVSSITLGIALRYVLEALRKPPSTPVAATMSNGGKMFRFGMFALDQFKERLHEWPQYCSHIVQIPHLKEGHAALIEEIEGAMAENRNSSGGSVSIAQSDGQSVGTDKSGNATMTSEQSFQVPSSVDIHVNAQNAAGKANGTVSNANPASNQKVSSFGPKLGRAVNGKGNEVQHESPPDSILDRVQFIINNVTMSNVEQKAKELRDILEAQFFGWLGHYLVVKRISTQPNFHSVYLAFLEQLGDYGKGLIEAILSSVYFNVGKLLRSPKITTSTSERSLLKNLGSWLGQITLARNKPILQITLDCKELLFQGYENGMLIAVTPFVAKILEGAKNSVVFRPPNPWLMGLLSVFRALYGVDDLKMNIKFEVEVLCKNLGVKLEDIPLRTEDLAKRIPPVKTRNPDFNTKTSQSSASGASTSGQNALSSASSVGTSDGKSKGPASSGISMSTPVLQVGSSSPAASNSQDQQSTVIPNLASYVTINQNLNEFFASGRGSDVITIAMLKRNVPIAVDKAIREIIQPVVERSVSIACGTTKEIVTKDFAMESDENKMRKSAQLMVANLAGSLALVTCREPLRASVSSHLRQLLMSSISAANNAQNNEQGKVQLSEQDQSILDQCISSCSQDNLELGCKLIEKAATEKAVRDVDEALSEPLSVRKKHREQTGQPFYDMSIFGNGNQRYPAALPEPLRPKPGGLRNEQLLVYDAFARIHRHHPGASTAPTQGTSTSGSTTPTNTVVSESGSNVGISGKSVTKISVDALSSLAMKLDNSVTVLLGAVGPRASQVTLRVLPNENDVKQLLVAAEHMTSNAASAGNLSPTETDSILKFAQNVFKRLYELRLSEPLRLEVFVALLKSLAKCCHQLGQDLGTWATYAPTETDDQRKLHRTVLLLLLRNNLLPIHVLDEYLNSNMDEGRNVVWTEFTLVFASTAIVERILNPQKLVKVMSTLTKIGNSHSLSHQIFNLLRLVQESNEQSGNMKQFDQAFSKSESASISGLNALVDNSDKPTHQQSSSISTTSLNNLAEATKRAYETIDQLSREDPQGLKHQVTVLLEGWMRICSEAGAGEKPLQYVQLLQQNGIGKNEEQTERFFRTCTDIVVGSALKNATPSEGTEKKVLNYTVIDSYGKLLSLLVKHMNSGGSTEEVATERVNLLNKILGITVRTMMAHYERNKRDNKGKSRNWDQRPWFRLMLVLILELNSPNPIIDPISNGILNVFASAFHVIQPLVVPGFAFAWLELISHRMFLSNLLLLRGQKGWALAHQLLIDLFLFLEPHLRKTELTDAVRHLYKGTMRVLLVLLHDFPGFLAGYHLSFCNVIPENCIQLRNLVLSAFPRGMRLPDPFTPNLKIDLLDEISKNPPILSNVAGPLTAFRSDLDNFLKNRQPEGFLNNLIPLLLKDDTKEIDSLRVNALVLYVGMQAITNQKSAKISQALAHTPEMEILKKLMEFNDSGRYITLNAVANQLRYPSSHTHYYSCVMLFLFSEAKDEGVREQVTRVLLERLIVHRPHPWGLLITFIELIKNQRYQFWSHPFTRCATEIEKVFESVARSCMAPGSQRSTAAGGDTSQQQSAVS